MSESKHTPAPWTVVRRRDGLAIAGPGIVMFGNPNAADAALIAAAPDLLEVLRSFPGFTDDASVGDPWAERMRAAIEKAEGK